MHENFRPKVAKLVWRRLRATGWLAAVVVALGPCLPLFPTEVLPIRLNQEGASTLIIQELPGGKKAHILVDTGNRSNDQARGGARVKKFLDEKGIRTLDLVILTHLDADHAAGFVNVLGLQETFVRDALGRRSGTTRGPPIAIRAILSPAYPHEPDQLKEFHARIRAEASARSIPLLSPADEAAKLRLERLGIEILALEDRVPSTNASSLVTVATDPRSGKKYVLTGDMTKETLAAIKDRLPATAQVLEAPHHGADPTLLDLVKQMKVGRIVIHACEDNRFNHPSIKILKQLADFGRPDNLDEWESILRSFRETRASISAKAEDALDRISSSEVALFGSRQAAEQRIHDGAEKAENEQTEALVARYRPHLEEEGRQRIYYDQIVITGERRSRSRADRLLDEFIWNELHYLPLEAASEFKNWTSLRRHLALRAADRLEGAQTYLASASDYLEVVEPAWFADVQDLVARSERKGGRRWPPAGSHEATGLLADVSAELSSQQAARERITSLTNPEPLWQRLERERPGKARSDIENEYKFQRNFMHSWKRALSTEQAIAADAESLRTASGDHALERMMGRRAARELRFGQAETRARIERAIEARRMERVRP